MDEQSHTGPVRARECESIFGKISVNAAVIGMQVNPKKTQLLCTASSVHSKVKSFIEPHQGEKIACQDELVLLGFKFGRCPYINAHVHFIEQKYNSRSWMIRHLKMAGVPIKVMVGIYTAMICPVIEYACQVYGPLLAASHVNDIEKLQWRILKIIYGHRTTYQEAIDLAGTQTLEERRITICGKFAQKTLANGRFSRWFPREIPSTYPLRHQPLLEEKFASTERLYKSPIFTMRRVLNALA